MRLIFPVLPKPNQAKPKKKKRQGLYNTEVLTNGTVSESLLRCEYSHANHTMSLPREYHLLSQSSLRLFLLM